MATYDCTRSRAWVKRPNVKDLEEVGAKLDKVDKVRLLALPHASVSDAIMLYNG